MARITLIGSGETATYGSFLYEQLAGRFSEAIIATAYLTEDAAHALRLMLPSSPRRRPPRVRLLVGDMQNFTRKAAVRALLDHAKRDRDSVALEVLRPEHDSFHLKAAWFRGREETAAVGSHNLTFRGLASTGELGVCVSGVSARDVGEKLRWWCGAAPSWAKSIRSYEESRQMSQARPAATSGGGAGELIGATGLASDSVPEDDVDQRNLKRTERLLPAKWRGAELWPLDYPAEAAIVEDGYVPGAVFDSYASGHDRTDWHDGQKRAIYRVLGVVPCGNRCVIVCRVAQHGRRLLRYTVTPEIRRRAERIGLTAAARPACLVDFTEFIARTK